MKVCGCCRGDDDINDVAAMGGVNLAEESQRILGSTEFVGTQIRSCKDDLFLHSLPLLQKVNQIGEFNPKVYFAIRVKFIFYSLLGVLKSWKARKIQRNPS